MDSWSEKQLKHMSIGGNKNLEQFFAKYDLNDEQAPTKYRS